MSTSSFWRSSAGRTLIVLAVVAVCGAAAYASLTRSSRGRFLVATRVTGAHRVATRELAASVRHGLARIDVDPGSFTPAVPGRGLDSAWVVTLPPRLPLAEANLALTQAVTGLGGVVWDAVETRRDGAAAVQMTLGSPRDPLAQVTLVSQTTQVIGVPMQRIALVFLDATASTARLLEPLLATQQACAVALSPNTPGADTLAARLAARGAEILLDMPMESKLGPRQPGAILVDMSARGVDKAIEDALTVVRGARGVANLDGSLALQDEKTMTSTLSALQQRRLYFLEVPVTTDSVCRRVGRQLAAAVLTAQATLDGRYSEKHGIHEPLQHVVRDILPSAHKAIVVVCGDSLTYRATVAAADSFAAQGVSLVPLSTLMP